MNIGQALNDGLTEAVSLGNMGRYESGFGFAGVSSSYLSADIGFMSGVLASAEVGCAVDADLIKRRNKLDREIPRGPEALATTRLVLGTGARIEGPAVDREEPDVGILPEGVLSAVAVVHVPIDDQHAVEP